MKRILLACVIAGPLIATVKISPVTYYRDVVPVLQKHCLSCHRPGQIAPMSFTSYQQTKPWVEAIRHVIVSAIMPPWTTKGPQASEHALSLGEVDILLIWIDEGAVEGDPKDAPPPAFPEEVHLLRYKTITQHGAAE
jgi:hypothetical protein